MKEKSDPELLEILRENARSSSQYQTAEHELEKRDRRRKRRPALTRAIVGAILVAIAVLAYLRTG